jgi:hypothetical protein
MGYCDISMIKKVWIISLTLLFLASCAGEPSPTVMPSLEATPLNEITLTPIPIEFTITHTWVPTATVTPAHSPTPIPTIDRTRPPIQSPTAETPCDHAAAGQPIDVTIPDGTLMAPGESFTKTWRLKNVGSCTWTRLYALTFFSGNSLSAIQTNYLSEEVAPGEVIDISVDMEAPQNLGVYQSNWMLTNAEGALFGIGPNGDAPFWVQIEVTLSVTDTPQPSPTVTPTPVVYLRGDVEMADGDQLDLDSGDLNPSDDTQSDFAYRYENDLTHTLLVMNNTQWMVYGEDRPNFNDCNDVEMTGDMIRFEDVPDGTYVCYRTSRALPGRFLIGGLESDKLLISFLTWAVP